MALLLPAVQYAREAGRRATCAANLKQFGIAWNQYVDAHGCLPMGRVTTLDHRVAGNNPPCTARFIDKSILVSMMPFLEQTPAHDSFNQSLSIFASENTTVHTKKISVFACPSDTGSPGPFKYPPADGFPLYPQGVDLLMARTSYSGAFGSLNVIGLPSVYSDCKVPGSVSAQANGAFTDVHPIKPRDVTDGLSKTIFMSEKAVGTFGEIDSLFPSRAGKYGWWVSGNLGDTLFTAMYPVNAYEKIGIGGADGRLYSASSYHGGGVHAAFGDGSVSFISDSIDSWSFNEIFGTPNGASQAPDRSWQNLPPAGIWQSLNTRNGNETLGAY
jgi:prepilin-type processing-associated H-X9-DG protein